MLFIFIPGAYGSTLYKIYSNGVPRIFNKNLNNGDVVELNIENGSFFSIYETTSKIRVTKYSSMDDTKKLIFEYGGNSTFLSPIDRVEFPPALLRFEAFSDTEFSIAYGSIAQFRCDNLVIDNSDLLSYNPSGPSFLDSRFCFFYGARGKQRINGVFGECHECPILEIYAGDKLLSKIMSMNTGFSNCSPDKNTPLFISISPQGNSSYDINNMRFNMTSDYISKTSRSREIFNAVGRYSDPIPDVNEYKIGLILTYTFFGLFCTVSLVLVLILAVQIVKEKHPDFFNSKTKSLQTVPLYTAN